MKVLYINMQYRGCSQRMCAAEKQVNLAEYVIFVDAISPHVLTFPDTIFNSA